MRILRDIAGYAPDIIASKNGQVSSTSSQKLLGAGFSLMTLPTPMSQEAWSTAWSDPALRVPLFQVFSCLVRHLEKLMALKDSGAVFCL